MFIKIQMYFNVYIMFHMVSWLKEFQSVDRKNLKSLQNQVNPSLLFYYIWPTEYLVSINKTCQDLRVFKF